MYKCFHALCTKMVFGEHIQLIFSLTNADDHIHISP